MEEQIKFLGDLQRVQVRPGDKFVLTVDQHLSHDAVARIGNVFNEKLGSPVIVLGPGMKLGVVGEGKAESSVIYVEAHDWSPNLFLACKVNGEVQEIELPIPKEAAARDRAGRRLAEWLAKVQDAGR